MEETKSWLTSKAMLAGVGLIVLTLGIFAVAFAVEGQTLKDAAETTADVMKVLGPVLGGLAIVGLRTATKTVGVVLLVASIAACQVPGASSGAGGSSVAGGYVGAGGEQEAAAGTNIAVGGNQTFNIYPKPGVTVPENISDAVAKVMESDAPIETKAKILDVIGRLYGFTVEVHVDNAGNADNAGSTGRSGIPPINEPDPPEEGEGDTR